MLAKMALLQIFLGEIYSNSLWHKGETGICWHWNMYVFALSSQKILNDYLISENENNKCTTS